MFRLGIIEESVTDNSVLEKVKPYFYSQRIENIPKDEFPIWHTNEYHIDDDKIEEVLTYLQSRVNSTWYIHAFSETSLYVVLVGKWFYISLNRDETWNEMIEYGVKIAKVERHFLENIPLHV